jgi:hypothetical protein
MRYRLRTLLILLGLLPPLLAGAFLFPDIPIVLAVLTIPILTLILTAASMQRFSAAARQRWRAEERERAEPAPQNRTTLRP